MFDQPKGYVVCAMNGPSPYPDSFMHQDGVQFNLDKEHVNFTVLLQTPTGKEIYDFTNGRAQFALCVSGPVIFFLSKFGDQPWSEAPYSANLLSSELRGMPEGYQPGMRISMTLMLIDSSANIIKGLRYLTLSAKLSEALAKEIKKQMGSPVSRSAYEKAISDAYLRYPTARSMKKDAIIVSSDRFAEEMQSSEQVEIAIVI
jgi:hypothetical protein